MQFCPSLSRHVLPFCIYVLKKALQKDKILLFKREENEQMTFEFSPELKEYMHLKKRSAIAVTVADTSNTDLNVEELYIRAVDAKTAAYMKEKQGFHSYPAEFEVLLPNYILDYAPTVKFYIKKFWIFKSIKSEGISF